MKTFPDFPSALVWVDMDYSSWDSVHVGWPCVFSPCFFISTNTMSLLTQCWLTQLCLDVVTAATSQLEPHCWKLFFKVRSVGLFFSAQWKNIILAWLLVTQPGVWLWVRILHLTHTYTFSVSLFLGDYLYAFVWSRTCVWRMHIWENVACSCCEFEKNLWNERI